MTVEVNDVTMTIQKQVDSHMRLKNVGEEIIGINIFTHKY